MPLLFFPSVPLCSLYAPHSLRLPYFLYSLYKRFFYLLSDLFDSWKKSDTLFSSGNIGDPSSFGLVPAEVWVFCFFIHLVDVFKEYSFVLVMVIVGMAARIVSLGSSSFCCRDPLVDDRLHSVLLFLCVCVRRLTCHSVYIFKPVNLLACSSSFSGASSQFRQPLPQAQARRCCQHYDGGWGRKRSAGNENAFKLLWEYFQAIMRMFSSYVVTNTHVEIVSWQDRQVLIMQWNTCGNVLQFSFFHV